jgi:type IV pilus assembly protein PilM
VSRTRVIGLDIGTTAVRAAEVDVSRKGAARGKVTVTKFGQVPLPLGAVRDGEVAEPQTVATAIRQLWRDFKFGSREVVLGVGNQRVMVRDLTMPAMPMDQLRSSLPFQVQDMLPVAVDDVILDFYPTTSHEAPSGTMVNGLLVAATKDTVHANAAAAETAGLRPLMVDLTGFALARYHAFNDEGGQVTALVDIGARVTVVVIMAYGVPRLVRILPNGGQDATDALTNELGVSASEAEDLKRRIGVGMAVPPELRGPADTVNRATQMLVEAIRNTLVYYAGNNPGAGVDVIVLSGGGSRLNGFGQFLSNAARTMVTYGVVPQVSGSSGLQSGDRLSEVAHALPIAVGLALGEAA